MLQAAELERALASLAAAGEITVHENGERLAALNGSQFEVRQHGDAALLHLWSPARNLVRRVVSVGEKSDDALVLEVERFGHARHARLELRATSAEPQPARPGREQFRARLRQLLADQFPDETLDSLTASADLQHSLSGSYARGVMHRGAEAQAVMGVAPGEDIATTDGILTFALIWLDLVRTRARKQRIAGLRLYMPRGASAVTAHRLGALASPQQVQLYEYDPRFWRVRRIAISDAGNLATRLTPRREIEAILSAAAPEIERIRRLSPQAIEAGVAAGTRDVTLRFRGLEFARWRDGAISFGLGPDPQPLTPAKWPALERLVEQLETHRSPLGSETKHRLYRAQAERWLETRVAADPARIDARLDPQNLYAQVPAFSASDRGIIDLLGVTREGRLAVLELKAAEDIQLVMQAVDYWLRVRWHHEQDDFQRYGYFPGVDLQKKPPLLLLVAPGFRFHPSSDAILRSLSRDIEIVRVGLAENWRRGLRVIFRQSRDAGASGGGK